MFSSNPFSRFFSEGSPFDQNRDQDQERSSSSSSRRHPGGNRHGQDASQSRSRTRGGVRSREDPQQQQQQQREYGQRYQQQEEQGDAEEEREEEEEEIKLIIKWGKDRFNIPIPKPTTTPLSTLVSAVSLLFLFGFMWLSSSSSWLFSCLEELMHRPILIWVARNSFSLPGHLRPLSDYFPRLYPSTLHLLACTERLVLTLSFLFPRLLFPLLACCPPLLLFAALDRSKHSLPTPPSRLKSSNSSTTVRSFETLIFPLQHMASKRVLRSFSLVQIRRSNLRVGLPVRAPVLLLEEGQGSSRRRGRKTLFRRTRMDWWHISGRRNSSWKDSKRNWRISDTRHRRTLQPM